MKKHTLLLAIVPIVVASCFADRQLKEALEGAAENRSELEQVLTHYKDQPEKWEAAKFLIRNMPAHYSYSGDSIQIYYRLAERLIHSELTPLEQHDSLLHFMNDSLPGLNKKVVPDTRVMTAEYLINNIDHAFKVWKNEVWAQHLDFHEFCEWLLPYKAVELQELDCWRDTLSERFSESLADMVPNDVEYPTMFRTLDYVRNEIIRKVGINGMYVQAGYPLLSAHTLAHQTFGRCEDYVNLAVLTYRSLGLAAVIDEAPYYGRFRNGHIWYTILADRGQELPAEWDLGSVPGWGFFPYERFPKIYRHTYAMNPKHIEYATKSAYKYPLFRICMADVTDKYQKTCDTQIEISKKIKLKEKYCYIATFNGRLRPWSIVGFGEKKRGKACFQNMGKNIMYIALGYDGNGVQPISDPFILHSNGSIEYIIPSQEHFDSLEIKRKYLANENVETMRRRIVGAKIQCADKPDFSDATDVLQICSKDMYGYLNIEPQVGAHRFWRYLAADGTYGSIAELAFLGTDGNPLSGKAIACKNAHDDAVQRAFDNEWLSNFETEEADGAWVGMAFDKPQEVAHVMVVPRSDDNDIHPGDEYELKFWDGDTWVSCGKKVATDFSIVFHDIPKNTIMWLSDLTRGWDERAFRILKNGKVEWW